MTLNEHFIVFIEMKNISLNSECHIIRVKYLSKQFLETVYFESLMRYGIIFLHRIEALVKSLLHRKSSMNYFWVEVQRNLSRLVQREQYSNSVLSIHPRMLLIVQNKHLFENNLNQRKSERSNLHYIYPRHHPKMTQKVCHYSCLKMTVKLHQKGTNIRVAN